MNKEIPLTEDELKQMLKGTLLWSDIATRLNQKSGGRSGVQSGIRKLGTPLSTHKARSFNLATEEPKAETLNEPLYPERDALFQPLQEKHSELREVQALISEHGEGYQKRYEGAKVIMLLSFAGIAVVSLWFFYFLGA